MPSRVFLFTHVGLAACATLVSVWVVNAPLLYAVSALVVGVALGAWAGLSAARAFERGFDRGDGVVMYLQEAAPYALFWPLCAVALFGSGTLLRGVASSPELQLSLRLMLCVISATWLTQDILAARAFRRVARRRVRLQVQWFHGRSVAGPEGMIGKAGEVTTPCRPAGYVRVGGELWRAESVDGFPLMVGQEVTVQRLNGLVLLVEAAERKIS